jgi:hypothetical protein
MWYIYHTEFITEDLNKMKTTRNLVVDRGTDFTQYIQVFDSTGFPVNNLTGSIVFGQIQKTYTSANITARFIVDYLDNVGNIVVKLESNVTSNIIPGRYVYNLFVRVGDRTDKLEEGIFTVEPSTLATFLPRI